MQHLFRVLAGLAIMLITGLVFIAFHWFAPKAAWANALTALLVCYAVGSLAQALAQLCVSSRRARRNRALDDAARHASPNALPPFRVLPGLAPSTEAERPGLPGVPAAAKPEPH